MNMFTYLENLRNKGFMPKNVLDIGANFGNFSMQCKGQVWPFLTNFYLIEANEECKSRLMFCGFPYFFNLLGDEDGKTVTFYKTKDAFACTGNSYYKENTKQIKKVK